MAKKFREVRKALRRARWTLVRTKGDHEQWRSPDGPRGRTIAGHDNTDVPVGTLKSIGRAPVLRNCVERLPGDLREQGDTSWGAYSPDLPGVAVAGASREEVERLMRDAIPLHLEDLGEAGISLPQPRNAAGTIST